MIQYIQFEDLLVVNLITYDAKRNGWVVWSDYRERFDLIEGFWSNL